MNIGETLRRYLESVNVVLEHFGRQIHSAIAVIRKKPPNTSNALFFYAPILGSISYVNLSWLVFCPDLRSSGLINFHMFSSISGFSLLMYNHKIFTELESYQKAARSFYLSSSHVLGSILLWAILSKSLPGNRIIRLVIGTAMPIGMLKINQSIVNKDIKEIKP